jgi:hypothetical protein
MVENKKETKRVHGVIRHKEKSGAKSGEFEIFVVGF